MSATSNGDLREKDIKKAASTSSKPKSEISEGALLTEKSQDGESIANDVASVTKVKASSPVLDASVSNEVKIVPKAVEDGAKRVNSKPKWNRFEVETKPSSQNRRKTDRDRSPPRRNNRDEYYSRRDDRAREEDRSSRRGNSSRGSVPSSSTRAPRNNVVAPVVAVPATAAVKPTAAAARGPRREPAFITRSNRPSYTESKTPGLNGNPLLPIKSSDLYDAKKQKPLLGRPILIDAVNPLVTAQNIFGTYYFNGPTPFILDMTESIKEQIKKQM